MGHFGGVCGSASLMPLDPDDGLFSASASAGMSIYRTVDDIEGSALFLTMGASILTPIGFNVDIGSTWSFDAECSISGMTASSGISTPSGAPAGGAFEVGVCYNPFLEQISGNLQSPRSSAKAPEALKPAPTTTQHRGFEENAGDHSVSHGVEGKRSPSVHQDEEPMMQRPPLFQKPLGGGEEEKEEKKEEGVFVLELSTSSVVIVALCAMVLLMTAIVCWQCLRRGGRGGVYSKVDMVTDSDMEAARLNGI